MELNQVIRTEPGYFPVNAGERGVYSSALNQTTVYSADSFSSGPFEDCPQLEILYPA